MRLTFSSFEVTTWEPNKDILDGKKNVIASPHDDLSWATITGFSKDVPAPVGWLGLHWIYELSHKDTKKTIKLLEYIADDRWLANLENRNTDEQELDDMILKSYERFTEEYDKRKMVLKIRRGVPNIEQSVLNQIRLDILKNLKDKGF